MPAAPTTECYETATFNNDMCTWDVTGDMPEEPTTECYETAMFNNDTCTWDVTGDMPEEPTTECYETATFNNYSCEWDVTGEQPTKPETECYETATFNNYSCEWDVTGDMPEEPSTTCSQTATFDNDTCTWDVIGSQIVEQTGGETDLCIGDDFEFDLFSLLEGDFQTDGSWSVTTGNTTINGSLFNPIELELGEYTFNYSDTNSECPSETKVTINLNDDCIVLGCGDVIISKAVTPNGDESNEYFTLEGIDLCGYTVGLKIFNRWGAIIYESKDYQNDWNGFAHSSSVGGSDKVPTGTYYYIINLKGSGLKPITGPIYVGTN
jgi:gliding motility-associated-like protein